MAEEVRLSESAKKAIEDAVVKHTLVVFQETQKLLSQNLQLAARVANAAVTQTETKAAGTKAAEAKPDAN